MRVVEFLEDYALAFGIGDLEALTNFYDVPLAVIRPDDTEMIETREALTAQLQRIHEAYSAAGLKRMTGSSAEEVGFDDGLGIVNVRWTMHTWEGDVLTAMARTYVLRLLDDELRIAGVVSHDPFLKERMLKGSLGTNGAAW